MSDLNGNQVANNNNIAPQVDEIADTIGPVPFLKISLWPKPFTDKNNSLVSKTHKTHRKRITASTVLTTFKLPNHDFLNDSIIKTIEITRGITKPNIGIIVPL